MSDRRESDEIIVSVFAELASLHVAGADALRLLLTKADQQQEWGVYLVKSIDRIRQTALECPHVAYWSALDLNHAEKVAHATAKAGGESSSWLRLALGAANARPINPVDLIH